MHDAHPMPSETLRQAAALMRERAEAARAGRWTAEAEHVLAHWSHGPRVVAECSGSIPEGNDANAEHIASWHPAVALAIAAAFEQHAIQHGDSAGRGECQWEDWACEVTNAAHAYLGESA